MNKSVFLFLCLCGGSSVYLSGVIFLSMPGHSNLPVAPNPWGVAAVLWGGRGCPAQDVGYRWVFQHHPLFLCRQVLHHELSCWRWAHLGWLALLLTCATPKHLHPSSLAGPQSCSFPALGTLLGTEPLCCPRACSGVLERSSQTSARAGLEGTRAAPGPVHEGRQHSRDGGSPEKAMSALSMMLNKHTAYINLFCWMLSADSAQQSHLRPA